MSGNTDFKAVRCPCCGGNQLTAIYDSSAADKNRRRFLLGGIIGLLISLRKKQNDTYWQCLNCGQVFPME